MQESISGDYALLKNRFPIGTLLVGTILTALLFLYGAVREYQQYIRLRASFEELSRLDTIRDHLIFLDGLITDTARQAAQNDRQARARLEEMQRDWEQTYAKAVAIVGRGEELPELQEMRRCRGEMQQMEDAAVDRALAGQTSVALSMLVRPEYLQKKVAYRGGARALARIVSDHISRALDREYEQLRLSALMGFFFFPLVAVVWGVIIRYLRRWHGTVAETIQELAAARDQIESAHAFQQTVLDSLNESIVVCDRHGNLSLFNRSSEAIHSLDLNSKLPPADWARYYGLRWPNGRLMDMEEVPLYQALHGETVQNLEMLIQAESEESPRTVVATARPIIDRQGEPVGAVVAMHDITAQKKAEEGVRRQLQKIAALHQIDIAITGSLDLKLVLDVVIDQVMEHLQPDAAQIVLLNEPTQTLEQAVGRGFRTDQFKNYRLRIGEGTTGYIAQKKALLGAQDLQTAAPEQFVRIGAAQEEGFRGYYGAPLMAKGKIQGVLETFFREPFQPDQEWLDFLTTLATQAAVAIDDANLFEDLQKSNLELRLAYDRTLEGWVKALDLRDKETEGHTQRVTEMTVRLAKSLGIRESELVHIRRGALLHDIGKLGVPDAILLKPGRLTEEERGVMQLHTTYAYEWLSPIDFLRPALDIPFCHHERWDGTGYPRGLKGEEIPLAARVFAVIDVWDALRSDRPYRSGWDKEKVREHLLQGAGSHFDARMVDAFLRFLDEQTEEGSMRSNGTAGAAGARE